MTHIDNEDCTVFVTLQEIFKDAQDCKSDVTAWARFDTGSKVLKRLSQKMLKTIINFELLFYYKD